MEYELGTYRVITCISLQSLDSLSSVLRCQVLDLVGLGSNNVVCVCDVLVNEILILDVDKRPQINDAGRDQSHAPERDDSDEIVREECRGEALT